MAGGRFSGERKEQRDRYREREREREQFLKWVAAPLCTRDRDRKNE